MAAGDWGVYGRMTQQGRIKRGVYGGYWLNAAKEAQKRQAAGDRRPLYEILKDFAPANKEGIIHPALRAESER